MKTHEYIPFWSKKENGNWGIGFKAVPIAKLTDQEANYIDMAKDLDPNDPNDAVMLKKIFIAFAGEKPTE